MSSGPSIAVLMPNWNDARFLPRSIRSILDQPVKPDEIVIVDDGSTDNSVEVIRREIAGEPTAKLVTSEANHGIFAALELGMRHLRSEYVLFLAANDFLLPGIFARAKQCLARNPGIGLWSAMSWLVDEKDRPIRLHPSAVIALRDKAFTPDQCVSLAYRIGNWFTGSTLVYNREKLVAVGGFNPEYGATTDLFAAFALASLHGASFSPVPFAGIRVHQGSYSSRTLEDTAGLEKINESLHAIGPKVSPRLFTPGFLDRMALRYRFSAVRASRGGAIGAIARLTGGWKSRALAVVDKLPGQALRMLSAYLVLVPFDAWPHFRYRVLGWVFVRIRASMPDVLRGRPPAGRPDSAARRQEADKLE